MKWQVGTWQSQANLIRVAIDDAVVEITPTGVTSPPSWPLASLTQHSQIKVMRSIRMVDDALQKDSPELFDARTDGECFVWKRVQIEIPWMDIRLGDVLCVEGVKPAKAPAMLCLPVIQPMASMLAQGAISVVHVEGVSPGDIQEGTMVCICSHGLVSGMSVDDIVLTIEHWAGECFDGDMEGPPDFDGLPQDRILAIGKVFKVLSQEEALEGRHRDLVWGWDLSPIGVKVVDVVEIDPLGYSHPTDTMILHDNILMELRRRWKLARSRHE